MNTSFTPEKSAGRHTAYLTATNGHLVAAFDAAADIYIAALAAFYKLGGRDHFDAMKAADAVMIAARDAVLESTDYRSPAVVYTPANLTPRERIEALGRQYGLTGKALKVFVTETHDAHRGLQTFDDAAWRVNFARGEEGMKKPDIAALREWHRTEVAATDEECTEAFAIFDSPEIVQY